MKAVYMLIFSALILLSACGGNKSENGGDSIPPTVQSTTPGSAAGNIAPYAKISATFSEPMDPASVNTTTFTLTDGASSVAGEVTYSDNIATFAPHERLEFQTQYHATITAGAKDSAGNGLVAEHSWTFTTSNDTVRPACFEPVSSDPVLAKGNLFAGATWNDPHVIHDGTNYVMYASADVDFDQNIKIYRLTSADGVSWSLSPTAAVFEKSVDPGAWDAKSVETPAVVLFKGTYYLFYTGYPVSQNDVTSYKIGYATSGDGINWTRKPDFLLAPTDPAGAPNLQFNQYLVAEPAPVVFNDKLYLYFTALGADTGVGSTLQTIGLVATSDGVTWSDPQQVLKPDQNLYPRGSNWKGYSTPHATVLNGKMHLFFSVASDVPYQQLRIHHAVSADGISGWTQDSEAIFAASDFAWTATDIRSPAVYFDNNTLHLWFAGHHINETTGDISMGIGLARCAY